MDLKTVKKAMAEQIVKLYMIEHQVFTCTPSQMALACLDVTLSQLSEKGDIPMPIDLTQCLPDLDLSVWDKIGDIKKYLTAY